jgi:hypothetical protein
MKLHPLIVLHLILCAEFISLFFASSASAQLSSPETVHGTVQISVCGNHIVEDGEDCEYDNLNGSSCLTLGNTGGTLTCDISCSYDTAECTWEPPQVPTQSSIEPILSPVSESEMYLKILELFDLDNDAQITDQELYPALKRWVDNWRKYTDAHTITPGSTDYDHLSLAICDINADGICNLHDFSILLYHVEL